MKGLKCSLALYLSVLVCSSLHPSLQEQTVNCHSRSNDTLYFLILLPLEDPSLSKQPSFTDGLSLFPAVRLAVEHINRRCNLLSGYVVDTIVANSGCDLDTLATISFVSQVLHSGKKVVGIIGPGCSTSSLEVAPLVSRDGLSLICIHFGGSPILSQPDIYPNALGMSSPVDTFISALFALFRASNWDKVAAFYDTVTFYQSTYEKLSQRILEDNSSVTIAFQSSLLASLLPVENMVNAQVRVGIVIAGPELASKLLCLAFHKGIVYPGFQWVFIDLHPSNFNRTVHFRYSDKLYTCNAEDFIMALDYAILLNYRLTPVGSTSVSTDSGLSHDQYLQEYTERINRGSTSEHPLSVSPWGAARYDATWALALALNKSINFSNFNISEYSIGKANMTNIIREQLYETTFSGVSGTINFDHETGFVGSRGVNVSQLFQNGSYQLSYYDAVYQELSNSSVFETIDDEFLSVPSHVRLPVTVFFLCVTAILSLTVIVLHVQTYAYRNHSSVRASSPKLSGFIYLGAYILIVEIALYMTQESIVVNEVPMTVICNAVVWCLSIQDTLIFGTVCVRTWRIYRIFTHFKRPGRFLSDRTLMISICALVSVSIMLCALWSGVDHLRKSETDVIRLNYSSEGIPANEVHVTCSSNYFVVWFLLLICYKTLLTLIAVCLAVMIRHMHSNMAHFNKQKSRVAMMVYATVIVYGMTVPMYLLTQIYRLGKEINFIIFLIAQIAQLLLCLLFIVLPPLLPIFSDKSLQFRMKLASPSKRLIHMASFQL